MNHKQWQDLIPDYLSGNLSMEQENAFVDYLAAHHECATEVNELETLWNGASTGIPEPSREMDHRFYDLLQSKSSKSTKPSIWEEFSEKLNTFFAHAMVRQTAFSMAILLVGMIIGRTYWQQGSSYEGYTNTNPSVTQESQYVMALMEQPSATKRIQTVQQVSEIGCVTETIIGALFATLNSDHNINVRLSAIEALAEYAEMPKVRQGLVASIAQQTSPIVQIALADLMVVLQEREAIEPINQLLQRKDLNESVKFKMEKTLQHLI